MKNWFDKNYKTLIIAAFLIPIITVAIVSISHVTKWYGISNPVTWSVYLSIGIEIAALSALAAISANMGKKVYFPFAIVTLVQFIGNIYFAYSYIDINAQSFKDWVGLVSPFVEFMGVDPNDFAGHKRFLAFFAGGMLPIISLSFLHMLVKFTEEDRLKETSNKETETPTIPSEDIVGEVSRIRLSEEDLAILEKHLLNPQAPNEALQKAADDYKKRGEMLSEMMQKDQELGLYDEPFDNPLIKNREEHLTETFPLNDGTTYIQSLDKHNKKEEDKDWENFQQNWIKETEEDLGISSTIEPTEEDEDVNFSTIEPISENIFQDDFTKDEMVEEISEEVKQDDVKPYQSQIDNIDQMLSEVEDETFSKEPTTLNPEEVITDLLNELIEDTSSQEERTEVVPALSDEEVRDMFMDEWEKKYDLVEEDEVNDYTPEPVATPEEIEQYQIEQDIQDVVDAPIVDQDNFGDNFDTIATPTVVEKFNIEESKPEITVTTPDFETESTDNDFWRQHVITEDEEDLKKNS